MPTVVRMCLFAVIGLSAVCPTGMAQLAPEIGYAHPAGARIGTTVDVILGGYDWTPDMQLFVHDPRVKIELLGPPSPVLISEPPYWFGAKARGYAWPLPREFRARLSIPPEVEVGFVRWQVANANGVSPSAIIHLDNLPEVVEQADRTGPQELPELPVIVSGQIKRIEEVDRYLIRPRQTGPITVDLLARSLTSPSNQMSLHGVLQVHDDAGRRVEDCTASEGNDLMTTFVAEAHRPYQISLHDLDFAGDRSYVYRLRIQSGPQVLAAYPSAGKRGERQTVEFVGWGVATGSADLESVTREVSFPAGVNKDSFAYVLETPWGRSPPYEFLLSDLNELVGLKEIADLPAAVTGNLQDRFQLDSYAVRMQQGDVWEVAARSRTHGHALDLDLTVTGPDGAELAVVDDVPGSTDPELTFSAPADGVYRFELSDRSAHSGNRAAAYRISFERPRETFSVTTPESLSLPLGTTTKLPVTVTRRGGFQGPIELSLEGLPQGVTTETNLVIPEMKNELTIELACPMNAKVAASLTSLTARAAGSTTIPMIISKPLVLAITMKPRIKITPEGLDDVSKVRRGSTHLFPLNIERLEGFEGEITLEMTAKQQRHRQGLSSDEFVVPAGISRVSYPIFVPEWMETTKTSRMILNGSIRLPDPQGNMRTLLQRMELRLGILPEGAILKLGHRPGEYTVAIGEKLEIPLNVSCLPEFREPIQIELVPNESLPGLISAEPIQLSPGESSPTLVVSLSNNPSLIGQQSLQVRASAYQEGKWLVRSETSVSVEVTSAPPATSVQRPPDPAPQRTEGLPPM